MLIDYQWVFMLEMQENNKIPDVDIQFLNWVYCEEQGEFKWLPAKAWFTHCSTHVASLTNDLNIKVTQKSDEGFWWISYV